jgi:hypothetical protein
MAISRSVKSRAFELEQAERFYAGSLLPTALVPNVPVSAICARMKVDVGA